MSDKLLTENEESSSIVITDVDDNIPDNLVSSCSQKDVAARSLDGRLLCASQCAYEIKSSYIRCASYLHGSVIKRISRSINSVLIGRTIDGIVIAFRGTLATSALDWFQNSAAWMSSAMSHREGFVGKVHIGFYNAVKALWDGIKPVLLEMMDDRTNRVDSSNKIFLTGHSKGGAMASIAAMLITLDKELPNPTYVATFGSARFANKDFCNEYNKRIEQTTYENNLDLIPFLPLGGDDDTKLKLDEIKKGCTWGFQPIGNRHYIDESGTIITNVTKAIDDKRISEFEERTITQIQVYLDAHKLDCDGGYSDAIVPEICINYTDLTSSMISTRNNFDERVTTTTEDIRWKKN